MSKNNLPFDAQESPEDLAALYVAGAMTYEERKMFESRLNDDDDLLAALRSFDGLGELLLNSIEPVEPDPKTRLALLAQLEQESKEDGQTTEPPPLIRRSDENDWIEIGVRGVTMRVLYADQENKRLTALLRVEPGAVYPSHVHNQAEECLVLEGDLDFGDYVLRVGDYVRVGPGTTHGEARSKQGCLCLVTAELPDSMVA